MWHFIKKKRMVSYRIYKNLFGECDINNDNELKYFRLFIAFLVERFSLLELYSVDEETKKLSNELQIKSYLNDLFYFYESGLYCNDGK